MQPWRSMFVVWARYIVHASGSMRAGVCHTSRHGLLFMNNGQRDFVLLHSFPCRCSSQGPAQACMRWVFPLCCPAQW
jgi:hypothetical protein